MLDFGLPSVIPAQLPLRIQENALLRTDRCMLLAGLRSEELSKGIPIASRQSQTGGTGRAMFLVIAAE
jgi:hypothetical protein